MASLSVVVVDPGCKGCSLLGVTGEDLSVGPLGLQGAVEAFYLSVLPAAVRFDEHPADAQLGAHLVQWVAVGPGVIGHDSLDVDDAVVAEIPGGAM
jgi:hypothetical protein